MSLLDIWNWLINADLLAGLELLGMFIVGVVLLGVLAFIRHKGLLFLYKTYPRLMRGTYRALLLTFLVLSALSALGLIADGLGAGISSTILGLMIMLAIALFFITLLFRKPEEGA